MYDLASSRRRSTVENHRQETTDNGFGEHVSALLTTWEDHVHVQKAECVDASDHNGHSSEHNCIPTWAI